MADPVSIGLLIATSVGGGILRGISQKKEANAQASALEDQASVDKLNAGLARQRAAESAAQANRRSRLRVGAAKARAGASGAGFNTFEDVTTDLFNQGKIEENNILNEGDRTASSFLVSSAAKRSQASATRNSAKGAIGLGIVGGLLSAGGSIASAGITGGFSLGGKP